MATSPADLIGDIVQFDFLAVVEWLVSWLAPGDFLWPVIGITATVTALLLLFVTVGLALALGRSYGSRVDLF